MQKNTKELLEAAEIVSAEYDVSGSLFYYPFGWKIRNNIYGACLKACKELGYEEIRLPDLIETDHVRKIDSFAGVFDNYLHVIPDRYSLAASHEGSIYPFLSRYLRMHPYRLPIKWVNIGGVFRKPKNTVFPFNYGERASFLECYSIVESDESAVHELLQAEKWNRYIVNELFNLPSVEVIRPRATNKAVSKKTVCLDTYLPSIGKTVITGMTYFHERIFTRCFNVKYQHKHKHKNIHAISVHFGVSDNLMFSILDTYQDDYGYILPRAVCPYDVTLICSNNSTDKRYLASVLNVRNSLNRMNIRIEYLMVENKKIKAASKIRTLQGIPITIVVGLQEYKNGKISIKYRHNQKTEQIRLRSESLDFLHSKLDEFDSKLSHLINTIKNRFFVTCNSMSEVNLALDSGRIAKLTGHTKHDIEKIEANLLKGEVLGLDAADPTLIWISRRI